MTRALSISISIFAMSMMTACQSHHEEGVTSSYRSQWTDVNADTKTTTEAARAVLQDEGLKDINASSTNVDGMAEGRQADNTKVNVAIKKTDKGSQVSVTVGMMGNPSLGAETAKRIKEKAENMGVVR